MHIGPEHVTAVTAMRVATTTFRAGGMPEADYRARIDAFWPSMGITLSAGAHAGAAGAASQAVPARPPSPTASRPSVVSTRTGS